MVKYTDTRCHIFGQKSKDGLKFDRKELHVKILNKKLILSYGFIRLITGDFINILNPQWQDMGTYVLHYVWPITATYCANNFNLNSIS